MIKKLIPSVFVIALLLSTAVSASSTSLNFTSTANVVGFAPTNHKFDYVVVILLENQPLTAIMNGTSTPYMKSLADNYSLAVRYTGIAHDSLPNYIALLSGQPFISWAPGDCGPSGDTGACTTGNTTNLVDRLEAAQLTWKAYAEDYPSSVAGKAHSTGGCYLGEEGPGNFYARHLPFLYFNDIIDSSARCAKIVPANSVMSNSQETPDLFLKDLNSVSTSSNFMWLTPNGLDDGHDSSAAFADKYLSMVVPQILGSTLFKTQKAALFIVFDEGVNPFPADWIYAVWAGSVAKTGYRSSTHYSHYSFVATIEQNWGLKPFTSNDVQWPSMFDSFK